MATPEGKLTPAQFGIMRLICNSAQGMKIGESWDAIRADRDVNRNTVLNLADRLKKRGWLERRKDQGVFRCAAAVPRQSAEAQLASELLWS